jgi:hypothetical protein
MLRLALVLVVAAVLFAILGKSLPAVRFGRLMLRLWVVFAVVWMGMGALIFYPDITAPVQTMTFAQYLNMPADTPAENDAIKLKVLGLSAKGQFPDQLPSTPASASLIASRALDTGMRWAILPGVLLAIGLALGWAFRGARVGASRP